jgi:hypothetical protein
MPARTPLPVPTNSEHTRRSPSAHPPLGAQLCARHGSTAAYTLDTPTSYTRHGLTATHRLHTITSPPKSHKDRRTHRLAHKLCTRHGSTTTWLYTHQTHPQEKAHLPDLKHYTRHQGSAETATNASQNTIAGADKLSTHTALSIGAPTAWRTTLRQTRLHGCIHTRHTHQLYQAWPHGHP